MRKAIFIILIVGLVFSCPALADDQKTALAVESVGEINAKDNNTGTALAGMETDLILTVIADMSQAEPGEEIESLQITLPGGFAANEGAVTSVRIDDKEIANFEAVVDRERIVVVLPTLIVLSAIITIEFTVDAPPTPIGVRAFMITLLNILQKPIIIAVQGGNADGRINNDSLIVTTVAATKPEPPSGVGAQPDQNGENDIVISWTKSDDPAVSGYFIYRSDKGDLPAADVADRELVSYIDRDLNPGEKYTYTVRSYKTSKLKSDASSAASAVSPEDTQIPEPPTVQSEVTATEKGIEIVWEASPSLDVDKYVIYRGGSLDSREAIGEASPDAVSYLDETPPESGSYLYVVVAVDDVGNESVPSATQIRQVLSGVEPQPNPFTPLSSDPRFNQITFPAAMLEGGEGVFTVRVFDLEGNLVFEEETESSEEIKWDGKDTNGECVNSGIYVYQAVKGNEYKIGSIVVAK